MFTIFMVGLMLGGTLMLVIMCLLFLARSSEAAYPSTDNLDSSSSHPFEGFLGAIPQEDCCGAKPTILLKAAKSI